MPSKSTHADTEVLIEEQLEDGLTENETSPLANSLQPQDELTQLRQHLQFARQQVERAEHCVESSLTLMRSTLSNPERATLAGRVDELFACLDQLEPKLAALFIRSHQKLNNRLNGIEEKLVALASNGGAAGEGTDFELPTPDNAKAVQNRLAVDANLKSAADLPSKSLTSIDPAAMFGTDLINDTRTETALVELTQRLKNNDPGAMGLVGQLLAWRSATRERIPKLLAEVGDAYYACFPRTEDQVAPLEQALMEILERKCIESDIPNSIELVRLGARFDPSCHRLRAGDRGTAVTEIHGWIVVGADGHVLNRAHVGVK